MKTLRAWFLIILGILLVQGRAEAQGPSVPEEYRRTARASKLLDRPARLLVRDARLADAPAQRESSVRQSIVTGVVTEAGTLRPLPAAQVVILGTSLSAFTGADGRFEIRNVPAGQVEVQVQLLGYATVTQTVTVPADGNVTVSFQLEQAVLALDGLVVTALGIERERASLTYSVSEVKGADFTEAREINVANALIGKVAGVNATSLASGPGGSSRVVIRGSGSQRDSNQPLYVVNGMPITNAARAESDNVGGSTIDWGDGISSLNPDDIESITVLKGGPAAALYGSQAANGVILITTKQGKSGRPTIEFNSNYTVGSISVYPDYQTEYGQGNRGRRPQSQAEAIQSGRLSFGDRVDGQPSIQFDGQMRPYSAVSIKDNMKNFYRQSSNVANTLSIAGGTESLLYRVSVSDLRAESIQPNSGYKRKTANLSLGATITDRLKFDATLQANRQEGKNRPGVGYVGFNANWGVYLLANTVDIRSLAPGYDPESLKETAWQHVSEATNPYFVVNRMGNSDESDRYMMQSSLTFDLLPNLYIKGDVMGDFGNNEQEMFTPRGTNYRPLGVYQWSWRNSERISSRLIAGYNPRIGEFSISAMAGGDIERATDKSGNIVGSEFVIPEWISHQNLAIKTSTKGISQVGTHSLFGSVDLGYRDMAFLSASGRQDWFSTLNPASNSIFYPAVGGSFILSRAVALPDVFDVLRVRASWAQVGASTVGRGEIFQTYGFREGGHLGQPVQTNSSRLNNPNLRPLSNRTSEVGIDLELFNRRFAMDLTVYDRLTTNDIILIPIAPSSGASSTLINAGKVSNKGVELLLSGTPLLTPSLNWTVSYNMAYNKNRVLSLGPGQTTGGTSLLGLDMSTFFEHTFRTTEDGTPIFDSRSKYELRTDVPVRAGVGVPPYTMGLTNTLSYKDWTLDVLMDGKFGHHFFSQGHQYMIRFGLDKMTLPGRDDGLTVTGVDENGNPFTHHWPASFMDTYYNNMGTNNRMLSVQDGRFIKLRSVVLRYDLPVRRMSMLSSLRGAQISLVGRNVATLYKKTTHFDPEQHYLPNDNSQNSTGVMLPATREIGLNVRLQF